MPGAAGRFAPSPTGPLHFGSLLAATASYLDARSRGERWLLRIDDLDLFRNVDGSEAAILRALEAHGLHWDGPIIHQSDRIADYQAALATLADAGHTFYCNCSRRQLKGLAAYPGTCRANVCRTEEGEPDDVAIRVRVNDEAVVFTDLIGGTCSENLAQSPGDFIVRRRDGLIAYQLATAVDDGAEQITRVIRGGDLKDNSTRQIHLIKLLGLCPPAYAHLPTLVNPDGQKLSKQSHSPALDPDRATENLLRILPTLSLTPPADGRMASPGELLAWATDRFSLSAIRGGDVIYRH